MKKGKLWTALLLTMVMCINPVRIGWNGTAFYENTVKAEEDDGSDTDGENSTETEIDPTVQTNDING